MLRVSYFHSAQATGGAPSTALNHYYIKSYRTTTFGPSSIQVMGR